MCFAVRALLISLRVNITIAVLQAIIRVHFTTRAISATKATF